MKEYVELEKADVDAMAARDVEAAARLSALEAQFDLLKKTLTDGKAAQDAKIVAMDKDRAALDVRVKAVEAWWTTVDKALAALDTRLKKAEPELVSLDARLDKAEPELVSLDARLDKAEPVLVSLATRLDQNDAKDKGQDATDTVLDARAKLLETFKTSVDKTIADYADRLAKLEKPAPVTPPVTPAP